MDSNRIGGWASEDVLMLLETMQRLIPKQAKNAPYTEGLKEVDWKLVAFYPFTPTACEQKWNEIFEKLNKTRTVAELLAAAEVDTCKGYVDEPKEKVSKAIKKCKRAQTKADHEDTNKDNGKKPPEQVKMPSELDGLPLKPASSGYIIFCKEQMKQREKKDRNCFHTLSEAWNILSMEEKENYKKRCKTLKNQYLVELNEYLKTLDPKQQLTAITVGDLKRPEVAEDIWTSAHASCVTGTADQRAVETHQLKDSNVKKQVQKRRKRWLQEMSNEIHPVKMQKLLKGCHYLDVVDMPNVRQNGSTSDSEDEDFADTSDEEGNYWDNVEAGKAHEEKEGEEEENIMFDIY